MNTGINLANINSYAIDNDADLEDQNSNYQVLRTPKKRNNRFDDIEYEFWSRNNVENSATSGQRSVKSSNSKETTTRKLVRKHSPGMSPFSKFCSNLSPLYNKIYSSHKRQKLCSISKFSVEYMKSPTGEPLQNENSYSLLREITPEKIEFDVDQILSDNDTPTFNFHHTESVQEEFPFLDNKENVNVNRKVHLSQASNCENKINRVCKTAELSPGHQTAPRVQEISKLQEGKSRGSTSPESNGIHKNAHSVRKISSRSKNQLAGSQFNLGDYSQSANKEESKFFGDSALKMTRKSKKREGKVKTKRNEALIKLNSVSTDKQEKGCNCKKSQCKKLYCECFLSQKMCTPACSCFSCCNTEENTELIEGIRNAILEKNPNAFKDKITLLNVPTGDNTANDSIVAHTKGCKCRRSKCLTGYCECHQLGAKCSDLCKCESCHNQPSSKVLETPPKKH